MNESVVEGAKLKCNKGTTITTAITVTSQSFVRINNKLQATEEDIQAERNIIPFGDCKLKPKKGGYYPCAPAPIKWENTSPFKIDGMKELTTESFCMCSAGGKIMILESPESSFESVIMKSESLSEENYENILSSRQEKEKSCDEKYTFMIEREMCKGEFNPFAKPITSLDEVQKILEKVNSLRRWNEITEYRGKFDKIASDLESYGVTYNKGRNITLSTSAFKSYAKLGLIIGHELQHVFHHFTGDYEKWLKVSLDYAKARTEYEAWRWTWQYVNQNDKNIYSVYESYLKWEKKYKALNGGKL